MLKAVFMGSPEFAVASLEAAHQACQIVGVYTQPDKPRGRGNKLVPTPVKTKALELGLPVFEPKRIRDDEVIAQLRAWAPDVILVVAYAKLIPPAILELPRFGCVNVHPSLLPRYRGAIPLLATVMNGDAETGVCTFFMDVGYDTGDVILMRRAAVGPEETGEQLSARLALVGAEVLVETVQRLASGDYTRTPQPAEPDGPYTKPMKKQDFWVDWSEPSLRVRDFIRALAHEPGASTKLGDIQLKLGRATVLAETTQSPPGTVLGAVKGKGFSVATGSGGVVLIEQVKPPGKNWIEAWSYLQGGAVKAGQCFEGRPQPVVSS